MITATSCYVYSDITTTVAWRTEENEWFISDAPDIKYDDKAALRHMLELEYQHQRQQGHEAALSDLTNVSEREICDRAMRFIVEARAILVTSRREGNMHLDGSRKQINFLLTMAQIAILDYQGEFQSLLRNCSLCRSQKLPVRRVGSNDKGDALFACMQCLWNAMLFA
ncbi:hypothetical protein ACFOY2_12020 [Nonomuraea purpurea]|uniref:Uncharacterized protein n=1 Tax=Nonomuraea purpurea TaxID=1849276 RepID=A0ABV8G1U3_9ACTN